MISQHVFSTAALLSPSCLPPGALPYQVNFGSAFPLFCPGLGSNRSQRTHPGHSAGSSEGWHDGFEASKTALLEMSSGQSPPHPRLAGLWWGLL